MDNNGFSKSAVDEVKNSEDFLSMSGVEHLVLCIEERDNGNYNRFLAHADAVLGWHRTKKCREIYNEHNARLFWLQSSGSSL